MKGRITFLTVLVLALSASAISLPAASAQVTGGKAKQVGTRAKKAHTFSFYATVVKAGRNGLVVRTKGGKTLRFAASQIKRRSQAGHHHSRPVGKHPGRRHHLRAADVAAPGPIAINIIGLQPGETVLIAETVADDGSVTITITLPPAGQQESASGVLTSVERDAFELDGKGLELRLHMAELTLSGLNLQPCQTVNVTYHWHAGLAIADSVKVTGTSADGDCAPTYDVSGTVAQVSGSALTVNTDTGPMSFTVSSSDVTDGYQPGDFVDVTYTQNSDGTMTAVDVQFVEQDATGTVTAVSSKSMTITDSATGASETFVVDPSQGLQLSTYAFDGVHVGDQIDVSYHQTAAGLVADCLDDQQGQQQDNQGS